MNDSLSLSGHFRFYVKTGSLNRKCLKNPFFSDAKQDGPVVDQQEQQSKFDEPEFQSVQTVACKTCDRHFTLERIEKHEAICTQRRAKKVYDIVQMRVKGTEAEKLIKEGKVSS